MMKLRSSSPSPFGRKIRIAAAILGLDGRIEILATDTNDPADAVRQDNPLGKIPVLTCEDGSIIYDSRVIIEYLDALAGGGRLIPAQSPERYRVLTLQALSDGILDACILRVYEMRFREPQQRVAKWLDYQAEKVSRALTFLEGAPPRGPIDIGQISLACALGYLDLRFDAVWRVSHPKLVAWLDTFAAAVPAFEQTRFTPPAA